MNKNTQNQTADSPPRSLWDNVTEESRKEQSAFRGSAALILPFVPVTTWKWEHKQRGNSESGSLRSTQPEAMKIAWLQWHTCMAYMAQADMADAETKHIWCFHTCGGGSRSTFPEHVRLCRPPEDQWRLPSSPKVDSSGLSYDARFKWSASLCLLEPTCVTVTHSHRESWCELRLLINE